MLYEHASIVVADDDQAIARLLGTLLVGEGYRVICCSSGRAAYAAIQKYTPNLAILDMQMKQRGCGLDVLQWMRAKPATPLTPVIIYSADGRFLSAVEDRLSAYHCGVLKKPFNVNTLLDLIARMIGAPQL